MNLNCQDFIKKIVAMTDEMKLIHRDTLEYFAPNEPPVTTLFAAIGEGIARDYDATSFGTNSRIFQLIEDAMASDDSQLVTAVATGLIEAIANEAAKSEGLWPRISQLLGERSLRHAMSWLAP